MINICCPHQRHAAKQDHNDDERLEVLMFDQLEHVAPVLPPLLSEFRRVEHLEAARTFDAALRTALVRVFDELDDHLVDFRSVVEVLLYATVVVLGVREVATR